MTSTVKVTSVDATVLFLETSTSREPIAIIISELFSHGSHLDSHRLNACSRNERMDLDRRLDQLLKLGPGNIFIFFLIFGRKPDWHQIFHYRPKPHFHHDHHHQYFS